MSEANNGSIRDYDAYPELSLCIAGEWLSAVGRRTGIVYNPATGESLGEFPFAGEADIESAIKAVAQGFSDWSSESLMTRYDMLHRVATLLLERSERIARLITLELGKPLQESQQEVVTAAGMFRWAAEESRRNYGRTIPSRDNNIRASVERVPVGPVAGFSGWNAPLITPARKISGALGAGCSIVMKPAEKTPAVAQALMECILDAGIPGTVVSMVVGDPAAISRKLLSSPVIRLVTFTGSIEVGKLLTAHAAQSMKRTVMELGGHAPVIVFDDVDVQAVALAAAAAKFRNAGQICTSPTRFFIQEGIYDEFVAAFAKAAEAIIVGNGLDGDTTMGPLATEAGVKRITEMVDDAMNRGAKLVAGGERLFSSGNFFAPTVLSDVTDDSLAMIEEPFGPLALCTRFLECEEAIRRANQLEVGLAGYAFTNDSRRANQVRRQLEVGTLAINHFTASWPETPFGGYKDSGLGAEGGVEGLQAFQQLRFISEK